MVCVYVEYADAGCELCGLEAECNLKDHATLWAASFIIMSHDYGTVFAYPRPNKTMSICEITAHPSVFIKHGRAYRCMMCTTATS
jgi:hypothetical protein